MNIHKPTALICTIMQISMQLSHVSLESFALRHKTVGRGECFMRNFCSGALWNVAAMFSNIHFSTYKAYCENLLTLYLVCLVRRPVLPLWVSTPKCTMMLISQFFDQFLFWLPWYPPPPIVLMRSSDWMNAPFMVRDVEACWMTWLLVWCDGFGWDPEAVWQAQNQPPMALMHERRMKKILMRSFSAC